MLNARTGNCGICRVMGKTCKGFHMCSKPGYTACRFVTVGILILAAGVANQPCISDRDLLCADP